MTAEKKTAEDIIAQMWTEKYPNQTSGYGNSLFKGIYAEMVIEAMEAYAALAVAEATKQRDELLDALKFVRTSSNLIESFDRVNAAIKSIEQ